MIRTGEGRRVKHCSRWALSRRETMSGSWDLSLGSPGFVHCLAGEGQGGEGVGVGVGCTEALF